MTWGLGNYNNKKRRERRAIEMLSAWKVNLSSNEQLLSDASHTVDHLEIDERPLDQIASRYPRLAQAMVDFRSEAREINNMLVWFAAFSQIQGKRVQTRDRSINKKGSVSKDMESFAVDYLNALEIRRGNLLGKARNVLKLLDEVGTRRHEN